MTKKEIFRFVRALLNRLVPECKITDKELQYAWKQYQNVIKEEAQRAKEVKIVKPVDIEAVKTAKEMLRLICVNYPFVTPKTNEAYDDYIHKASVIIDYIHRIDGYDWPSIRYIIAWSQQDPFWRAQIRSAEKLRKQFTTLMIQIKEEREKNTIEEI